MSNDGERYLDGYKSGWTDNSFGRFVKSSFTNDPEFKRGVENGLRDRHRYSGDNQDGATPPNRRRGIELGGGSLLGLVLAPFALVYIGWIIKIFATDFAGVSAMEGIAASPGILLLCLALAYFAQWVFVTFICVLSVYLAFWMLFGGSGCTSDFQHAGINYDGTYLFCPDDAASLLYSHGLVPAVSVNQEFAQSRPDEDFRVYVGNHSCDAQLVNIDEISATYDAVVCQGNSVHNGIYWEVLFNQSDPFLDKVEQGIRLDIGSN